MVHGDNIVNKPITNTLNIVMQLGVVTNKKCDLADFFHYFTSRYLEINCFGRLQKLLERQGRQSKNSFLGEGETAA